MLHKSLRFFWVAAILCTGCAKKAVMTQKASGLAEDESGLAGRAPREFLALSPESRGAGGGRGIVFAAPRFVAVRHKLEIVEPSSGLAKSIEAVVAFLRNDSVRGAFETAILAPSGNIAARVAPPDLNKFLDFVGKQGKIAQHATESEDKTAAVVDVEAGLKNQTDFRDNLRKMLTKPGVNVADLLQIQEKLAEAQAELDSAATQRKILANETEKVYVEIAFHADDLPPGSAHRIIRHSNLLNS